MKNILKLSLIIVILFMSIGCKGSSSTGSTSGTGGTGGSGTGGGTGGGTAGGGSSSGGGGGSPVAQLSFSRTGTPVANSVYLEESTISNNQITLNIKVKGGTDVYGGAIEINYDGNKLQYANAYLGDYLVSGDLTAGLNGGIQGTVVLGMSRTGNIAGVNGDGLLAKVVFNVLALQTNTPITFNTASSRLKSSVDAASNIAGTQWFGGTLSYQY